MSTWTLFLLWTIPALDEWSGSAAFLPPRFRRWCELNPHMPSRLLLSDLATEGTVALRNVWLLQQEPPERIRWGIMTVRPSSYARTPASALSCDSGRALGAELARESRELFVLCGNL